MLLKAVACSCLCHWQNLYLFLLRFGAPFVCPLYGLITSIVLGISWSYHQDCGCHICLCRAGHCNWSTSHDMAIDMCFRTLFLNHYILQTAGPFMALPTSRRPFFRRLPIFASREENKISPWPWHASLLRERRRDFFGVGVSYKTRNSLLVVSTLLEDCSPMRWADYSPFCGCNLLQHVLSDWVS